MLPPHFGVVGWKNSGKTALVCRLISAFTEKGYKVAAVKHAHHAFDIDHPGRDSFNFREAGAREVAVASANRWALMTELRGEAEPQLDEILSRLAGSDLVLVEGFKASAHLKIETRRREAAQHDALAGQFANVVAIAGNYPAPEALPYFDLSDIEAIAAFIADRIKLAPASRLP